MVLLNIKYVAFALAVRVTNICSVRVRSCLEETFHLAATNTSELSAFSWFFSPKLRFFFCIRRVQPIGRIDFFLVSIFYVCLLYCLLFFEKKLFRSLLFLEYYRSCSFSFFSFFKIKKKNKSMPRSIFFTVRVRYPLACPRKASISLTTKRPAINIYR